jgi:thioredoxin-related protein
MKKKLQLLFIALFTATLGFLVYQFVNTYKTKEARNKKVKILSEFTLSTLDGVNFTNGDMPSNGYKVFVFFNSECHYCQEEAAQLFEHKNLVLDNTFFYWISSEPYEKIRTFEKQHSLNQIENCKLLYDENAKVSTFLGVSSIPQFLVYDVNNKLLKNHKGAWRIDKLLEYLENEIKKP